jgi:radical SAM protein with 4Fe4S-binding SPASM domain
MKLNGEKVAWFFCNMSNSSSFFVYSPGHEKESGQNVHVLFHKSASGWVSVNDTGLEIAKRLNRRDSIVDVTKYLAEKYRIPMETAQHDVLYVSDKLANHLFLHKDKDKSSERLPVLNSIYLHLTNRCNLSCSQCYLSCPDNKERIDIPASSIFRMTDELVAKGGSDITLSGGEPLLHPEIKKILEYCAPKVGIRLLTNGTLIDKEWASFLSGRDIFIQISIDGSTREIHDAIRSRGSFDKAVKAVEHLQDAGLGERLNLCTTVMKQNLHDLKEIISLGKKLEVPLLRFLPLRREGTARTNWDEIGSEMDTKDSEEFYRYVSDLYVNQKPSVEISCGLSGFLLKIPEEFSDDDIWCPVGRQLIVDLNGDTYPCVLMMREEFRLGNIYNDSLSRMIESETMKTVCNALSERRTKIQKCSKCNWRNLCQAGCMGQALDHKDTIWDTDDFCDYRDMAYRNAFNKILSIRNHNSQS